jgi:YidC/Oxa1 family membrane protein insertase
MFVQQKLTMTDPKNKMLVYLMPLFFGWLFMSFPAGLVLYWTGFNILSLLETIFIRRKQEQQEAVTVVEEKG